MFRLFGGKNATTEAVLEWHKTDQDSIPHVAIMACCQYLILAD